MLDPEPTFTPPNIDSKTVDGFGFEWSRFTQAELDPAERRNGFDRYFSIFPWRLLPEPCVGADIGCGSGRWAQEAAARVTYLHLVDASKQALVVARRNLQGVSNVGFHHATASDLPFPDNSLDFAWSLGVLHHVPDTEAAIRSIARKLKVGAPFLIYLYYAFDNRPRWYRMIWRTTDLARRAISRMPHSIRYVITQLIAFMIYWPLARTYLLLNRLGLGFHDWPLKSYANCSLYVIRTDALDRFGTRLEKRFTKTEITKMLELGGFEEIRFSDTWPYWCALGIKGRDDPARSGSPNESVL